MRTGNKAIRDKAIPFISNFVDFPSGVLTYGSDLLAYPDVFTGPQSPYSVIAVPMTRPDKADIVEAYLYMEMTAPSDKALEIKLGIGTFTTVAGDLIVVPEVIYSKSYIETQHRKISGTDSPYSIAANGTLIIDADLTRNLHKRGEADFLGDALCLLVSFPSLPSGDLGYSLDKFKLSCTAQMGLGT